jgi:alcohol dehydrogenase
VYTEEERMSVYKFFSPNCSIFGYGCIEALEDEFARKGYKKALIVAGRVICEVGIADKVIRILDKACIGHALFNEVKPNPTTDNVKAGLDLLKSENCDFIVTIGGGSAHDCGKAIGILATNGGEVEDYFGSDMSEHKSLDIVAINTTAGTGSECTRAYVITDEYKQQKTGIRDRNALVTIAVDDHSLMMSLPPKLTAGTGMDALVHAIESYISINGFMLTSELAVTAMTVIFKWLRIAVKEPGNEKAREGMAVGGYLAGLAFGNGGVGMVHAISHQLSAVYDLPHGLCNAILLPPVMDFNKRGIAGKLAELARILRPMDNAGKSDDDLADIAIAEFRHLSADVGTLIPLHELGVKKVDFALLAKKALGDRTLANNPIQPSADDIIEVLTKAY